MDKHFYKWLNPFYFYKARHHPGDALEALTDVSAIILVILSAVAVILQLDDAMVIRVGAVLVFLMYMANLYSFLMSCGDGGK